MTGVFGSLQISFNAVMPMVILLAIGAFLRRKKVISKDFEIEANNVVYKLALPVYLFNATIGADLHNGLNVRMIVYGIVILLVLCFALVLVLPRYYKNNRSRIGAFISVSFNGGCAIPGLMLLVTLLPGERAEPYMLALPFWMIANMMISAIAMAVYSQEKKGFKGTVKFLVRQITRTPIIIGVAVGFVFNILSIDMPEFAGSVVTYVSQVATPLALITLGAQLDFSALKRDFKQNFMCGVILKLIVLPLGGLIVARLLGFTNDELIGLFLHLATPIGPGIYSMAVALKSDSEFLGQGMVVSQVFSCLTLFVGILIMTAFGIC